MNASVPELAAQSAANAFVRCRRRLRIAFALASLCASVAGAAVVGRGMDEYKFDDSDRIAAADRFPPWAEMMERRAHEAFSLEGCISSASSCTPSMRGARMVVLRGRSLAPAEQLQLVNRFVNRRRYTAQSLGTRWETPAAFLKNGGDCEDYAVTKYFLLRAMGVPAEHLRVVVGRTRHHSAHHALLAVRTANSAIGAKSANNAISAKSANNVLLLDTDDRLLSGDRRGDYLYLYSINEVSLWDHAGHSLSAKL